MASSVAVRGRLSSGKWKIVISRVFNPEGVALPNPPRIYHYRSAGGVEVDFVIEDAAGRVAAVEVKATRSLGDKYFNGLRDLEAALGKAFHCVSSCTQGRTG